MLAALWLLVGPARRVDGAPPSAPPPPAPGAATDIGRGASASDDFERGKTAFSRAEYRRAIGILGPLLYPEPRLDSEAEVVQAHRMLGVAHLFENQPEDARREFRNLIELRPGYRFDPLLDPPRVVDFFNGVLKEEETEIAALEARRKKRDAELALRRQQEADRLCRASTPTVRYEKHSFALNLLPFGAGQFQNGQRRKGWAFLGIEAVLGAVSVGAFTSNFALFGVRPQRRCLDPQTTTPTSGTPVCQNIDHSQEDLSRQLLTVQLVSGGLFVAVAAWGIIDAIRSYRAEIPLDLEPAPAAAGPSARQTSSRLNPTLLPFGRASGLGLGWSF
jgi:hypothetical protein